MNVTSKYPYSSYGNLASEYYSLNQYIKGRNLHKAFENIKHGLNAGYGEKNRFRLIGIRGSCFLESWKFSSAEKDFEAVSTYLISKGGNNNDIGHNQSKLGISYFLNRKFRRGFNTVHKSIAMYTSENADKVRSLRILALMYKLTLRFNKAKKVISEALDIAEHIGAIDQVRKMQLSNKIYKL